MFPEKTRVNRILPKAKFMKLAELSTDVRNEINTNIERLYISNVLNQSTINISKGNDVVEIDVFEFVVKTKLISDKLLREIDSAIPNKIVFVLKCNDEAQLGISFKEEGAKDKNKVLKVYRTEWQNYQDLDLKLNGLNLDEVYKNFLSQIAGEKLEINSETELKVVVEQSIETEKLNKKIEQLQNKLRNEKQFNKQLEIKKQIKELKESMAVKT